MVPADPSVAAALYAGLIDLAVIKGTVLVVVAGVACRLLRRRSASVRHGIWAMTFVGLLILPSVRLTAPGSKITVVAVRASTPAASPPAPQFADPPAATAGEAVSRPRGRAVDPAGSTRRPLATVGFAPFHRWIVTAWILGLVLQLGRFGAHLRAVAGLRARAAPCSDRVRRKVRRAAREVGLRGPPTTIVSPDVAVPSTFGVIHPSIVLPEDVDGWSGDELDAALLHELVHLRRRDYVTHLMTVLVKALYWINPLVWYAGRRLVVERERACDDRVVVDRVDPIRYAECLLSLAANTRLTRACEAVSFASRSSLAERVRSLLDRAQTRDPLDVRARLAIVGLSALIIVPATAIEVTGLTQSSEALVTALSASDPVVRRHAAWAMGESEDPAHVRPLIQRLEDSDPRVRAVSAWALGEIKDARAVGPLTALLTGDEVRVREMAVLAIGEIEAFAGLAAVQGAASAGVSIEAREWAAAQIQHRDGYPEVFAGELLHPAVRRSDLPRYLEELTSADSYTRALAAQRLGALGVAEAVDPLLDALEDEDPAVRAAAVWALDEINPSRPPDAADH